MFKSFSFHNSLRDGVMQLKLKTYKQIEYIFKKETLMDNDLNCAINLKYKGTREGVVLIK